MCACVGVCAYIYAYVWICGYVSSWTDFVGRSDSNSFKLLLAFVLTFH